MHSNRAHSFTGFSGAFRWLICTAQPGLARTLEAEGKLQDTGSDAADRGTLCHEVAEELIFKERATAKKFIGQKKLNNVTYNEEMAEATMEVVKKARAIKKKFPDYMWSLEAKMPECAMYPDVWGTCDMLGVLPMNKVIVIDHKFGNRKVGIPANFQLIVTGIRACMENGIDPLMEGAISGTILQPGQDNELYTFSKEEVKDKIELLNAFFNPNIEREFVPSQDRCHFCPCRAHCSEANKVDTSVFTDVVEVKPDAKPAPVSALTLPAPANVKPEQVADILAFKKVFDKWFKDFSAVWQARGEEGINIPGTKLVKGKKGARKWSLPQDQVEFYLRNMLGIKESECIKREVLSPSQLEKNVPHYIGHLSDKGFFEQEEGKPTLALEDDRRQPYNLTQLFSNVGE